MVHVTGVALEQSRLADPSVLCANMFARRLGRPFPSLRLSLYSRVLTSRSIMASPKAPSPVTLLPPREFPSSGFEVIDPSQRVEEERLPFYHPDEYYPMRIGAVIQDRYQVVAKLGYGMTSTVWLCHDLRYALLPSNFDRPFAESLRLRLEKGYTGRSRCISTPWNIIRS